MRVLEALELFLVQMEADGRSPNTTGQYRRHVRLFASWAKNPPIEEIGHHDLAVFMVSDAARKRPDGTEKKATSVNALRTSVRCFFTYLHQTGMLGHNPGRLVRRARCGTPPPRSLSDADQRKLLDVFEQARGPEEERDRVLYTLMLTTGIRIGSAVALDVGDVDLERDELHLRRTKGDRPDRLFIAGATKTLLAMYLRGKDGPLFQSGGGGRMSARHVRRRFLRWCERAGIRPVSPHVLRHTFGQRLYDRTGDIALVQRALLHRSISSTLVYARAGERQLRMALRTHSDSGSPENQAIDSDRVAVG